MKKTLTETHLFALDSVVRAALSWQATRVLQVHKSITEDVVPLSHHSISSVRRQTDRCVTLRQTHTQAHATSNHLATASQCRTSLLAFTTRLKFGERCFSHARPKAWNALPAELQDLTDHSAFKRQLKTFLFERALHECLAAGHFKCVSAGPRGLDWISDNLITMHCPFRSLRITQGQVVTCSNIFKQH